MTATNITDCGVLSITPKETFESYYNPLHCLDLDKFFGGLLKGESSQPDCAGDWAQVKNAIRRGTLFVIEAETHVFSAMIRFDPDHVDAGDYEIHYKADGTEKGRITKVEYVAADSNDHRISVLKPFPSRYVVTTVSTARPYNVMVWRIGLKDYSTVSETD